MEIFKITLFLISSINIKLILLLVCMILFYFKFVIKNNKHYFYFYHHLFDDQFPFYQSYGLTWARNWKKRKSASWIKNLTPKTCFWQVTRSAKVLHQISQVPWKLQVAVLITLTLLGNSTLVQSAKIKATQRIASHRDVCATHQKANLQIVESFPTEWTEPEAPSQKPVRD